MKKQLFLVFVLMFSSFWPFVYAQPTPSLAEKVSFCNLGGIGVVDLSYNDVTAIQGIVTQDVLTSAENYKTMKALRAVGAQRETGPAQVAKKYRLYFVGPDGQIKYADILENKFTSAQDWLLNTTIFGRVEYGGTMGEDLLVCPDLPTNEKGMCNYKAGDSIQDVYSKDWSVGVEVNTSSPQAVLGSAAEQYGKAYFSTVSNLVQMAQNANDPFGSVDIGMSRLRAHRYTVSLAAPGGSQLFVIPKTYMYFMNQLKNLAQFEAAAQAAFLIGGIFNVVKGFRSAGTQIANKESIFTRAEDKWKAIKNRLLKAKSPDDIYTSAKEIKKITEAGVNSEISSVWSKVLQDMGAGQNDKLRALVNKNNDEIVKAVLKDDPNALADTLMLNAKQMRYTYLDSDKAKRLANQLIDGVWSDPKLSKLLKYNQESNQIISSLEDIKRISDKKKRAEALEEWMNTYGSTRDDLAKFADSTILGLRKARTKSSSWLVKMGLANPKSGDIGMYTAEFLTKQKEISPFRQFIGLPVKYEGFETAIVHASTLGVAGAFLRSYLKALYYVGRPITAFAWGLQIFSELFLMNGYLELSPPGLTLAWNPQTTGSLFTKDAYILIKGTPSNIPGMYSAGALGSLGAQDLAEFLLKAGIDPVLAGKYSEFGQYLIFGYDFNPNAYNKIIKVEKEGQPTGITRLTRAGNGYLLRMANWRQTGISVLEDPTTMKEVGNQTLLTSVGMITSGADIYSYIYANPSQVKSAFPVTWTFAEKIGDFGFLSQAVTSASIMYLWPSIPRIRTAIGATLITGLSKSMSAGGKDLIMAKVTNMRDLENCVNGGNCTRPPCEQVCAQCQADLSVMSTYLVASGITQTILDYSSGGILAPVSFALGTVDMIVLEGGIPLPGGGIKLFEGKMEKTRRCLNELLTCDERNFIIIAGQKIQNPDVLMKQQQEASALKGIPGLDQLPVQDLLKPLGNMTNPISLDQEQLNIHGEFYNVTGRIALRNIYYLHIIDATIDFLANDFPLHMCGLTDNDTISQCVDVNGDTLTYGNTTIQSPLVPFKWMDTKMPAVVIPNTGVYVNISNSDCAIFSVAPDALEPRFNPEITSKFSGLNFTDLERTFGNLRVINLDEGSIYPVTNIDGKLRLEFDRNDGGYEESNGTVFLQRNGKLVFTNLKGKTEELSFRSAVFAGGTIVKRGDAIYILPRYFRPAMSGVSWYQLIGPRLFNSLNGQSPVAVDSQGNILGIDARNTKIPGADKLGIITAVSGYKDLNGDGKIQDNEKAGWRFYKVGNKTYFDLYYKGHKETYDSSQVEVTPDGTIKVYEKGKPHTDAYLLREISTRVDQLGRTLMTIKDGNGNTLLKDALITWLKGTGGSIQYNPDTNNYVFVNGQPIELNNEFKTNGFNAVTGMPDPPLLQPSAVHGTKPWESENKQTKVPPVVPTVPLEDLPFYVLAIAIGLAGIYTYKRQQTRKE